MAKKPENRALVVGISRYKAPFSKLPAVAADVRVVGKLLQSRKGCFSQSGLTVLTDAKATRAPVLAALKRTLSASTDDTIFVYLAGHGGVEGDEYYFIAYDTDGNDLASSGISLREIREHFDKSKSNRLFLWLDCCHSGGILKRRGADGPDQDERIVKRTLKAAGGTGRVIIAACTPEQFAYESASIGHGLFTDALVRGLKGEAEFKSEVTANSLYLYIDREIGSDRQRPMFFGEMAGRIVLMQARSGSIVGAKKTTKSARKKKSAGTATTSSGKWIMLGDRFFESKVVRQNPNNTYSIEVPSKNAADDAAIQELQPPHGYGGSVSVAFAHGNDACDANVESIASESVGQGKLWTIELKPIESQGGYYAESTMSEGNRTYSPADIAELRARRMLLNDPLEELQGVRSSAGLSMVLHAVEHGSRGSALECPIQEVFDAYKTKRTVWPKLARLRAMYALKQSGTVEHILNLAIGPVKGKQVRVRFRGQRRKSYSNEPAAVIECDGTCELTG